MSEPLTFTDSQGVLWSVREDGANESPADSSGHDNPLTWLSFETDLEARRLWAYPDDWRRFATWQLEALCRRAHTVVARFPRARVSSPRPRTST